VGSATILHDAHQADLKQSFEGGSTAAERRPVACTRDGGGQRAYLIERPETQTAVLEADTCLQENRPRDALMPLALAFARGMNERRLDDRPHFGFGLGLYGEDARRISSAIT
jgi:hypothetical protein